MKEFNKKQENKLYEQICNIARVAIGNFYKNLGYKINEDDMEIIKDETALKVFKNFHKYDSGRAKLSTWISRIAVNTAISHWNKYYAHHVDTDSLNQQNHEGKEFSLESSMPFCSADSADSYIVSNETVDYILGVIKSMGEKGKFLLKVIEGYSNSEIAKEQGVTSNRINVTLHRNRQALAKDLFINSILKEYRMSC